MSTPISSARRIEWVLGGIAVAVLFAAAAVLALTRTTWGRERVLALTLNAVSGAVNGKIEVERIDGGLLAGARLYGLRILEDNGAPVLLADSAYADYALPTLLGGDMLLDRLVLFDAEMFLRKLPGDSLWNYQRLLPPSQDTTVGRATIIRDARLVNARIIIRNVWEPDDALAGRARERAIAEALADTSRLMVQRVPGGLVRTTELRLDDARLSRVVIAPEERGGRYFAIDAMSGTVFLWRDPLRIARLEGELALLQDRVEFRADPVLLPDSRLSAIGAVDLSGEEPRYDLVLLGERLAFDDIRAIYPYLPAEGTLELRLTLETRPEGTLFRARQLTLEAPGTRVAGEFTLIAGDTLRFVNADLRAPAASIPTVEQMLPTALPVQGLHVAEAVARTPSP